MADHPEPSDRRLLRGARTRQTITRHAVDIASLEGLDGLTIGRLADAAGLSKSGVAALFGSKENLQVAAVDAAREMFVDAVVRPALPQPRGAGRLWALIEAWIVYAETPLFAGGCFRAANMADFDSRPGPVRDALLRDQRDWFALLGTQLRAAIAAGETRELDVDLAIFQIDAVLCAANTALRLGDASAVAKVRRTVADLCPDPG